MAEATPGEGHNSGTDFQAEFDADPEVLTAAAQGRLRRFLERLERLEGDRAEVLEASKAVYGEAKAEGFDTKILRKVIRLRKQDKVRRDEEQALLDLYLSAIGGL